MKMIVNGYYQYKIGLRKYTREDKFHHLESSKGYVDPHITVFYILPKRLMNIALITLLLKVEIGKGN